MYHPAQVEGEGRASRDCGVLLCHPTGHEYIRCHRGLRELAVRLARAGFPVVRFDYAGSGDSTGETSDVRLADWANDVRSAAAYLRACSLAPTTCLVGLRLGANLALEAARELGDVDFLALWQPVASGADYLAEIRAQHAELAREVGERESAGSEVLGFSYSDEMLRDIAGVDFRAAKAEVCERALLIDNTEAGLDEGLRAHAATLTEELDPLHVPEPRFWDAEPYEAVMPHHTAQGILRWLEETAE